MPGQKEFMFVFSGKFASEDDAYDFAFKDIAQEPEDEDDEEAWEQYDTGPSTRLEEETGVNYIETDFVESLFGDRRFKYLQSKLVNKADYDEMIGKTPKDHTAYIVIYESRSSDSNIGFELKKTPESIAYVGTFEFDSEADDATDEDA